MFPIVIRQFVFFCVVFLLSNFLLGAKVTSEQLPAQIPVPSDVLAAKQLVSKGYYEYKDFCARFWQLFCDGFKHHKDAYGAFTKALKKNTDEKIMATLQAEAKKAGRPFDESLPLTVRQSHLLFSKTDGFWPIWEQYLAATDLNAQFRATQEAVAVLESFSDGDWKPFLQIFGRMLEPLRNDKGLEDNLEKLSLLEIKIPTNETILGIISAQMVKHSTLKSKQSYLFNELYLMEKYIHAIADFLAQDSSNGRKAIADEFGLTISREHLALVSDRNVSNFYDRTLWKHWQASYDPNTVLSDKRSQREILNAQFRSGDASIKSLAHQLLAIQAMNNRWTELDFAQAVEKETFFDDVLGTDLARELKTVLLAPKAPLVEPIAMSLEPSREASASVQPPKGSAKKSRRRRGRKPTSLPLSDTKPVPQYRILQRPVVEPKNGPVLPDLGISQEIEVAKARLHEGDEQDALRERNSQERAHSPNLQPLANEIGHSSQTLEDERENKVLQTEAVLSEAVDTAVSDAESESEPAASHPDGNAVVEEVLQSVLDLQEEITSLPTNIADEPSIPAQNNPTIFEHAPAAEVCSRDVGEHRQNTPHAGPRILTHEEFYLNHLSRFYQNLLSDDQIKELQVHFVQTIGSLNEFYEIQTKYQKLHMAHCGIAQELLKIWHHGSRKKTIVDQQNLACNISKKVSKLVEGQLDFILDDFCSMLCEQKRQFLANNSPQLTKQQEGFCRELNKAIDLNFPVMLIEYQEKAAMSFTRNQSLKNYFNILLMSYESLNGMQQEKSFEKQ